ncbi:MAG: glycosyl transferase group 1, partial [Jatrophihabitans sp.]|nr:glycosyl transferase group 1 [Jatrophihabitans sp.]
MEPVRALLDTTAVPADRGGVGRYVDNLIPALVRAGVDVRTVCQLSDRDHYERLSAQPAVAVGPALQRRPIRLAWEQTGLIGVARKVGADLVHSPHYTHPVLSGLPQVVTLHDA